MIDLELKNLRSKLAYLTKKYEKESERLVEVAQKRKDVR